MTDFSAFSSVGRCKNPGSYKFLLKYLYLYMKDFFLFVPVFPEHSAPHLSLTPRSFQGVPASASAVATGVLLGELDVGQHACFPHSLRECVCFFTFSPCLMEHRLLTQSSWVAVVRLHFSLDTGRVSSRKCSRMTHDCP